MKPERILVAVDASPLSLAAAETAALLAERLGATVEGLYVEDINLARLAEHPEGTVISFLHARRHADPHRIIGQALKLQVTQARRSFERALGGRRMQGPFHLRRGRVVAEMLAAASEVEADLVVLGWHGDASPRRARLGSVARALAAEHRRPLLLLHTPLGETLHVAVLADDVEALPMAALLADQVGSGAVQRLGRVADADRGQLLVSSRAETLDEACCSVLLLDR